MISDRQNPAIAVYLNGKPLDLRFVCWADDSRGRVELLVTEVHPLEGMRVKMDFFGQPVLIEKRGDVRIIMPTKIVLH